MNSHLAAPRRTLQRERCILSKQPSDVQIEDWVGLPYFQRGQIFPSKHWSSDQEPRGRGSGETGQVWHILLQKYKLYPINEYKSL